ncbi:MAG TPA: glycosyltransferase [Cyclobacteriaceae bacterium]|nr:glycosyltransferase [Cyclobacteriaceae bacterium]
MLKVLMIGWEFPPHISGGLGTACHGLTTALVKEGVGISFVVPTLTGHEDNNGAQLISASEVEMPAPSPNVSASPSVHDHREYTTQQLTTSKQFNRIEIRSPLSPYTLSYHDKKMEVEWNTEILKTGTPIEAPGAPSDGKATANGKRYIFNGGYGKDLFEEVVRYSQAVAAIASVSDFDIIHAHDWMTFPAALEAKRISGKILIVHVHATEFDRAGESGSQIVYDIERNAINQADRVITVSKFTAGLVIRKYGVNPAKVSVVHNGIGQEDYEVKTETHPFGDNIITFLGRITFQKGPEYFVDAAEKVLQQLPDCHFVMAGSGDALPQMIARVAQKGLSSHFHFTGFLRRREIERVLAWSRLYVMPSVSEPFGLTPLEAIRAGVPVIISNQSGVSEVMPHALKVDFWDVDALSQAICSVIKYKSLANTLRANGREYLSRISWDAAAEKIKRIYHETINNYR